MWKARVLRCAKRLTIGLIALTLLAALPILWNESTCVVSATPAAKTFQSLLDTVHHRDEINSYLTYPEWSIVYAYEDFAAVSRHGSESDFAYLRSIGDYWTSLCGITRLASSRGTISGEYKVLLYVIGLSFTAEFAIKGLYESTIGASTVWLRGDRRTPEDEFALAVADDYAAFLQQAPWYQFSFGARVRALWSDVPLTGGSYIRKVERRFGLTLEYGVKALYAQLIGFGAALSPAPLRIRSIVSGLTPADVDADARIEEIGPTETGATEIETPRYRALTQVIQGLAARGRDLVEIAGNDDVLITVLAPDGPPADLPGAFILFEVPVQARPGWRRIALDVKVNALTDLIERMERSGIELEHVYDY